MSQDLINRYQPGGDIYAALESQYGKAGADSIAAAALSGDETQINSVLVQLKYGAPLETSTLKIFGSELATDPLGAPLSSLNGFLRTIVGSTLAGIVTNPWVLILVGGGVAVYIARGGGVTKIVKTVKGKLK